jgi:hypothetical protein
MGCRNGPGAPSASHLMTRRGVVARQSARFAVGTFDTWDGACEALRDLRVAGVDPTMLSFLGLRHTIAGAVKHRCAARWAHWQLGSQSA